MGKGRLYTHCGKHARKWPGPCQRARGLKRAQGLGSWILDAATAPQPCRQRNLARKRSVQALSRARPVAQRPNQPLLSRHDLSQRTKAIDLAGKACTVFTSAIVLKKSASHPWPDKSRRGPPAKVSTSSSIWCRAASPTRTSRPRHSDSAQHTRASGMCTGATSVSAHPFILKTVPPFLKDVRFLVGALREKIRNWVTVRSFRSVPILGDT